MTEYPQYRKYVGVDTWFKILSTTKFIELKRVGGNLVRTEVEAIQFPELNFIRDMLVCEENRWMVVEEKEYLEIERQG